MELPVIMPPEQNSRPRTSLPEVAPDIPIQFWVAGWWKVMQFRIGILPLPVYVAFFFAIVYFTRSGNFPTEISMMIAVLAVGGFTCSEAGKRIPGLHHFGAAAIFATFIPSALVYYHLIPADIVKVVTEFTKETYFIYLFIAAVIVGSILGMDRRVLISGFVKVFLPMALGTILATCVGVAVGSALGLGAKHTLFYIVLPVMGGGVGEGAIPLSTGYADILHAKQGDQFAQILPPIMFGSLIAVLISGLLNYIGKKLPKLTGDGRLQPGEHDEMTSTKEEIIGQMDVSQIAAAGSMAIAFYILGTVFYRLWGWPAPIMMLVLAIFAKLTRAIPPQLQKASYVVYRFFAAAVTYPLLFAIGVALTPWDKLVAAFSPANLVTIVATVSTMVGTGFVMARLINVYPIEMAIINACRCGQGGTGDVAILTAANRMQLMPFAQIATRIGGLVTVSLALIAMANST